MKLSYLKKILLVFILWCSVIYSQSIDSTLFKAYKYNSAIILDEFFMNWEKSNLLNSDLLETNQNKITNDTLKEIYNIANTFYNPVQSDVRYFILEDTLRFQVYYGDTLPVRYGSGIITKQFEIPSFRLDEEYNNTKTRILYMNQLYYYTLSDFFKSSYTEQEKKWKDFNSKVNFLKDDIKLVSRGNFSVPYVYKDTFISDSYIEMITLNKRLNKAILVIDTKCESDETLWEKINGKWQYIRTISVAIC